MLSSVLFMVIIFVRIHWIVAVNMCSNETTVGTDVTLNLVRGTGVNGCSCGVKLQNTQTIESVRSKITFEVVHFSGCKYRLVIPYNNARQHLSCSYNSTIFHTINKTDEIKLYLESTFSQADTEFEVRITSSVTGILLRLDCLAPVAALTSTTTSSQTFTTSRLYTEPVKDTTTPQLSTASSTNDMMNSRDLSTKQDGVCVCDDDGNDNAGIIGGVIGVIIGVVGTVVVVVIIRIVKNRKKKTTSEIYSSPSPQQHQPESLYTDLQMS